MEGQVCDELVAMTESLQQPGCSQNLQGVILAPTNDADSMEIQAHLKCRTGELREGDPFQGPPLFHSDALPRPHHALFSHVKNAGIRYRHA